MKPQPVPAEKLAAQRRKRVRWFYLPVIAIPVIAFFVIGEVATRTALRDHHSQIRNVSAELGWETSANARLEYVHPAFGSISYSTVRDGFRRYGNLHTGKTRILILGDSFTEAAQVSDGEGYFDYLDDTVRDVEIFAHGTGGYGSLQEYMMLTRHIDVIRPDVIVWQFSANDLINNDNDLETRNALSSRMVRPYYEDGRIEYRFGGANFLSQYSRLVKFVSVRVAMLRGDGSRTTNLDGERKNHPQSLERSVRTTGAIMQLVRQRAGEIPIVGFSTEVEPFADSVYKSLARSARWIYIEGVADSIAAASARGMVVDGLPRDGHWNRNGHAVAGRVIERYLMLNGLLRATSTSAGELWSPF